LGVQHQQTGNVIVGAHVSLLTLSEETARKGNVGIGLLVKVYDKNSTGFLTGSGPMPEHQTESGAYVDGSGGFANPTFLTET
jgi:hypothetical protein